MKEQLSISVPVNKIITGISKPDDCKLINDGSHNIRIKCLGMKREIILKKGETVLIIDGKAKKL